MTTAKKMSLAAVIAASWIVNGCGGGGDSSLPLGIPPSPAVATLPAFSTATATAATIVPAGVESSVSAFVSFLQGLSASDETSEPSSLSGSFAVPDDETNEPAILG
jgi:hypothetical protein